MINIVIPMAGLGSRFFQHGIMIPKPLILVKNLPFLYYAAESLVRFYDYKNLIFIGLESHNKENILIDNIFKYFPGAKIKLLKETPNGAVLTAREAIPLIDNDFPILFNDCDHMFYSEELRLAQSEFSYIDGFLLTFASNNPNYSYCLKDDNGKIIGTVEKKVVGFEAIAGVYGFRNVELFDQATREYLMDCPYSEFFMSGVYNTSIFDKKVIKNYNVDFNISFGTPEEYFSVKNSELFSFFRPV